MVGCAGSVEVTGTVFEDRFEDAPGLSQATVSILDFRGLDVSSGLTDGTGMFVLDAPKSVATIFATVDSDLGPTTSFRGVSGLDSFAVPEALAFDDGVSTTDDRILLEGQPVPSFYAVSHAEVDALRVQYAGCPGASEAGGVVAGTVRYFLFGNDGTGRPDPDFTPPAVRHAHVEVESLVADSQVTTACYLDADGQLYDPEASDAGDAQAFAIFGLQSGLHVLNVEFDVTDSTFTTASYDLWVPADGLVPRFPLWVEFPLF